MHLNISSAKWYPFCPGGDELTALLQTIVQTTTLVEQPMEILVSGLMWCKLLTRQINKLDLKDFIFYKNKYWEIAIKFSFDTGSMDK